MRTRRKPGPRVETRIVSRIHPVPLKSANRALWSTGVLRAHRALKRSMGVSPSWCALRMWWKGSLADLDSGNVKRA